MPFNNKVWDEAAREAERVKAIKERTVRRQKGFQNMLHRRAKAKAIWLRMGKRDYSYGEIVRWCELIETILRSEYHKGRKVIMRGFGSVWYEIYDIRHGGLIGHDGPKNLSVLKERFRPGELLKEELEKAYERKKT